jgi:hypothetical protein
MTGITQTLARIPDPYRRAAILALLALPLLVAGIRELAHPEARTPLATDKAILELERAQVPHHGPTQGAYSRFEFHHPGPAGAYLLLPTYLAGGRHSVAIFIGALIVNLLAMAAAAWLLRPWSWAGLLAALVVGLATVHFLGTFLLINPWGPYLTLAPLVTMVALTGRFRRDEAGSWILAALVGGILVQIHLLYVPVCGLLVATAFLLPRGAGVGLGRRSGVVLAGVALLLWSPVVLDLLRGSDANALALWTFLRKPLVLEDPAQRFLLGAQAVTAWPLGVVGAAPSPFPGAAHAPWKPLDPTLVWIAFFLQVGCAGWLLGRRRRHGLAAADLRITAAILVTLIWGVFAVLRIRGPVYPYILAWLAPVTAFLWALALAQGLAALWRRPAARLPVVLGCLALAAIFTVRILADDLRRREELPLPASQVVAELARQIRESLPDAPATGLHVARADHDLWGTITGLILELRKEGIALTACHDFALMVPPYYLDVLPDRPALWLTREAEVVADLEGIAATEGIEVKRIDSGSVWSRLAFGAGWSRPFDWGRLLRASRGTIVAEVPGPAVLRVELACTPEMTGGQDLSIVENGREVWSGRIDGDPWRYAPHEIVLADLDGPGRREIEFRVGRDFPSSGSGVLPVNLAIRQLSIEP